MRNVSTSFALIFFIGAASAQSVKFCKSCGELKNLQLPDVAILVAEHKASDAIKNVLWDPTVIIHKPFCRVLGRISKAITKTIFPYSKQKEQNTAGNLVALAGDEYVFIFSLIFRFSSG